MIVEINKAFKNYRFKESNHTYVDLTTGQELISVTTVLKKLRPEFDSRYWSTFTALKRNDIKVKPSYPTSIRIDNVSYTLDQIDEMNLELNPTIQDIRDEWNISMLCGQTLGTYTHNTLENLFLRKDIEQSVPAFVFNLKSYETIKYLKNRELLKYLADNFYTDFIEKYTPIVTECVVGDADLGIAGMFDILVKNNETNEIELWDYKTDKEIKYFSEYNNLINIFNIDDCEMNKYSLQLSIYKYLIEKNTNIQISKCNIAHFNYRKGDVNTIEAIDFSNEVKEFFENNDNKSIYFGFKTTDKRKRSR